MLSAHSGMVKASRGVAAIISILGYQGEAEIGESGSLVSRVATGCPTQAAVVVTSAWRGVEELQDTFVSIGWNWTELAPTVLQRISLVLGGICTYGGFE